MQTKPFPRPEWSPLPADKGTNTDGRVLLVDRRAVVADLRLAPNAATDIHAAPYDIHMICLAGSGFTMCDGETQPICAGQTVLWPEGLVHNVSTEDSSMETIMLEHVYQFSASPGPEKTD